MNIHEQKEFGAPVSLVIFDLKDLVKFLKLIKCRYFHYINKL